MVEVAEAAEEAVAPVVEALVAEADRVVSAAVDHDHPLGPALQNSEAAVAEAARTSVAPAVEEVVRVSVDHQSADRAQVGPAHLAQVRPDPARHVQVLGRDRDHDRRLTVRQLRDQVQVGHQFQVDRVVD